MGEAEEREESLGVCMLLCHTPKFGSVCFQILYIFLPFLSFYFFCLFCCITLCEVKTAFSKIYGFTYLYFFFVLKNTYLYM